MATMPPALPGATIPTFQPPQAAADQIRQWTAAPGAGPSQDPYELLMTEEGARRLFTNVRRACEPGREAFEWAWWRSLMYFMGRQWIYWDPGTRTWNDKRLARWIPKPVTNKVRETYDSIFALISDIDLGITARPVGTSPRNVLAAETADQIAPLLALEHRMKAVMGTSDGWSILLGNSFLHPHWDKNDTTHVREIRLMQCQLCQAAVPPDAVQASGGRCPNCGAQALQPGMKPDGTPLTERLIMGRGRTLSISPLEIMLPTYAQTFDAVDALVYSTWMPRHQVEAAASPEVVKRIQWGTSPQLRSLSLYRAMGFQTDIPITPQSWASSPPDSELEGCTVSHVWIKAGTGAASGGRYDRGVYLPFYGDGDGAIPDLNAAPTQTQERQTARPIIPYTGKNDTPLWPWVHYGYKSVPGRLYAQGAVDNVIPTNDRLNQIDSMTQLVANRMGNPVWLEQKGSAVERLTGEPGLIVRYQSVGQGGGKPERIGGENPPQSFFALRQQFIGDIEDAAGTYDVVKGSKPAGVSAFSALQLLVERSQSRFTPVFRARGEAYRQWAEIALDLERKFGPAERVKNALGPNKTWTHKTFQAENLHGAIELVIEDGTNVPKTALGRRAAIEHGTQLGILSPQTNPDQTYAMLQEIGISNLSPGLDADVKSALQEQQAFEDWAAAGFEGGPDASPLIRLPWHNDAVHLAENRKWMNGDAVRSIIAKVSADPKAAEIVVMMLGEHLMAHEQVLMQMQAAQAVPPGDDGDQKPGGGGGAMRSSNQESKPDANDQPMPAA